MKKDISIHNIILVVLFLGLISIPFIVQITAANKPMKNFENRPMTQMPKMSDIKFDNGFYQDVTTFISNCTLYINDNFRLRNILFSLYRIIKIQIFHVSPIPGKVVLGNNGWFFLGDNFSDVIRESKGIKVFTDQELARCVDNICHYDTVLTHKGIKFYFSVAPNKHTVYGSFLPIVKSAKPTKIEQLKFELSKRGFDLIDLKEDFRLLPKVRLFYKTGTHWTQAGAFMGYLSLMKRIQVDFPSVSVLKIKDFLIDNYYFYHEDLTSMLHMKLRDKGIALKPYHKSCAYKVPNKLVVPINYAQKSIPYETRFICEGKPLKILVFCDSFFINIIPFINQGFGETVIIRSLPNKDVIDIEKPDIVINETVERDLDLFLCLQ